MEAAELQTDPFPHLVIPDLLPEPFFRRLAGSIPPVAEFQPDDDVKSNLRIMDSNQYFQAAPEQFRETWTELRDDVIRDTVPGLRRSWCAASRRRSARSSPGSSARNSRARSWRPGSRRPTAGSWRTARLQAESAQRFGPVRDHLPALLHDAAAPIQERVPVPPGAPAGDLDILHLLPGEGRGDRRGGLVKEIPIRENMFVSFLNRRESLHGVRIDRDADRRRLPPRLPGAHRPQEGSAARD